MQKTMSQGFGAEAGDAARLAGPRVCIGQHFAMLEMGLIAAMLIPRFQLEWPAGAAWPKGDLAVTLRPVHPID